MPYWGLRDFLEHLESKGQLQRVRKETDWNLEMSHVSQLNDKRNGPALLFENVKDYPGKRVAMSVLNSQEKMALALELPPESRLMDMARHWHERTTGQRVPPEWVDSSQCKENILVGKDVNLYDLPAPFMYPEDGGRYLGTAGCLICRSLETGRINVGTHRGMLIDRDKMTILLNLGKDAEIDLRAYVKAGKPMPVAWVTGVDPALFVCSANFFPHNVSEYDIAGGLRGEPVPVVKGEVVDLPIPAGAEIVVEGEIVPGEALPEGPFGEWPGYYAGKGTTPVDCITVKAITYRDNPILWAMTTVSAGRTVLTLGRTAGLWSDLHKMGIPGIKSVYCAPAGGGRMTVIISLEQLYPGHSTQVGLAALASVAGNYGLKIVILVDGDIDPENWEEVLWALSMRYQPDRGTQIIKRRKSTPLDPSLPLDARLLTSSVILDTCIPYEWERKPELTVMDKELVSRIESQWDQYFTP